MGIKLKNFIALQFIIALSFAGLHYPDVRRDEKVIDDYFGTKVQDPYRWLEDLKSNETQKFVEEQLELTTRFVDKNRQKEVIRKRLTELWNYPKITTPIKAGKRYFTFENSGLQPFYVLYVQETLDGERREFLDINKLSNDGSVSMEPSDNNYGFSRDGEVFAYAVQKNGEDWKTIQFRNVSTGLDLPDKLENTKFPFMQWSPDNKGIFYTRLPRGNNSVNMPMVYYHVLGTAQTEDFLIAQFPQHTYYLLKSRVTDDGKYLVISRIQTFNENAVHVFPLSGGIDNTLKSKIVPVFPNATDAAYKYIGNIGSTFLFQTNKYASNFKLVTATVDFSSLNQTTDLQSSHATLISTFLEEHPRNVINTAFIADGDKLLVSYMEDVKHTLEQRCLKTSSLIQKIDLPIGSIFGISLKNSNDKEVFFSLENFLTPGTIYRCTFTDRKADCRVLKQVPVSNLDVNIFITEQIFYPSKDGTMVPMYIVRKNDTVLNGSTPALLWGYGGFAVSSLPEFSAKHLAFVDNFNGVYAMANIRGGGEYGKKWYDGGSKLNKQVSFDDFQAAAEYLIRKNYTSSSKLTIEGESNGGLLVGACVNQRPELYGAAISGVGVMDMIRIGKTLTGVIACNEYGCPDDKRTFETLYSYSPLHNIRLPANQTVQYPAVLAITNDHDDRVPPWLSYKYTAELQHTIGRNPGQTNPLLLYVEKDAGHGSGKPTSKKIDEATLIFTFLAESLNLEFKTSAAQ